VYNWEKKIRNRGNMLTPAVHQCGGDDQPFLYLKHSWTKTSMVKERGVRLFK
jgi:hypothetical protein